MSGPDHGGDPNRHVDRETLDRALAALPLPPRDRGSVALVVARAEDEGRTLLGDARLTEAGGLVGDRWATGRARPDAQLSVMRADVVQLLANGQPVELSGDNLLVDLDLSTANLPAGSRLRVGESTCEVTPKAHTGCRKFTARFGAAAMALTADPAHEDERLRGIYLRVLVPGRVWPGAPIEVLWRHLG